MGRTPVREALQRLAREGLVVILPRRGMFVSPVEIGAQLRLLERDIRKSLEDRVGRWGYPIDWGITPQLQLA